MPNLWPVNFGRAWACIDLARHDARYDPIKTQMELDGAGTMGWPDFSTALLQTSQLISNQSQPLMKSDLMTCILIRLISCIDSSSNLTKFLSDRKPEKLNFC